MFKSEYDENIRTLCTYSMLVESTLQALYPIRDSVEDYLDMTDPYISFLKDEIESVTHAYVLYQGRLHLFIKNKIKNGEDISIEEISACANSIRWHTQSINPLIQKIYDALIKRQILTTKEAEKININGVIEEIKIYDIKNDIFNLLMNRKNEPSFLTFDSYIT